MTVSIEHLTVAYGSGPIVVDDVSLTIPDGATVGLVGESGSGKSTLARALVGLVPATSGTVSIDGTDVTNPTGSARDLVRRTVQMVFQDPNASLNPRMDVGATLDEAARVGLGRTHPRPSRADVGDEVDRLLDLVGLPQRFVDRYPFELSGGQRQRVAVARALAAQPRVLLLDEVTASLDVSMQAVVLNLLRDLQSELGLAFLVISHDLTIIRYLCERVAVMELGSIKEEAGALELFDHTRHPYTRALLDAVPSMVPTTIERVVLEGDPPDPAARPDGCSFAGRCPIGPLHRDDREVCLRQRPELLPAAAPTTGTDHLVACHFPLA